MMRIFLSLATLFSMATAFSTVSLSCPGSSKSPCFGLKIAKQNERAWLLHLGAEGGDSESTETSEAVKKALTNNDGTFYDDEVEPAPKIGISQSMRDRLVREASSGLDADQKQPNVILYIIIGVAVLVVAGGAGIFY